MRTRPLPLGFVNSESSMPILRSTQCSVSTLPELIAISGMSLYTSPISPTLLRGKWVCWFVSVVAAQHATVGTVIIRRQRPSWTTSGMFVPHGASVIVNVPSTPVSAPLSGDPVTRLLHESHDTPGVNGITPYVGGPTIPFGTYTSAP